MRRSQSQPRRERLRAFTLRTAEERRRAALDIDFDAPRERAMSAVLSTRIIEPVEDISVPERHLLIAMLMLRDGTRKAIVAEPCGACGEMLELQLDLDSAIRSAEQAIARTIPDPRLRIPTGRDLERAATAEELIACCAIEPIDDEVAESILAEADPLGWITLTGQCYACASEVRGSIDLASKWLNAERQAVAGLLEEIHEIARVYHWSERDILGLSDSRRRQYLELCQAEREAQALERSVYV